MLAFSVDASYGDIGATTVSTFEWEATEALEPDALRIGTSQFYLIAGCGPDDDGWVYTIKVWSNNGTIQQSLVDSWEYDNSNGRYPSLIWIYGDTYAVFSMDATISTVRTFNVSSTTGLFADVQIDSINMLHRGNEHLITRVNGNVFACLYRERTGGTDDGWMSTVWINTSGTINNSLLDTQEFNPTYAIGYWRGTLMVDVDTIAIAHTSDGTDGYLVTYNISSSGVIANANSSWWEFDTVMGYMPAMKKVGTNIFLLSYTDTGSDIQWKTIKIYDNGTIVKAWIDAEVVWAGSTLYSYLFHVSGNTYGVGFMGDSNDGYVATANVTSVGQITARIDYLEFDAVDCVALGPTVIWVNQSWYLIVYPGTDTGGSTIYDGWSCTVQITTNYASPVFSNPVPTNASTGVSLSPQCNITINDMNGDLMTLSWYENSTGSWVLRQTNSSCSNGTYRWDFTEASSYGTSYWWKVYANDTLHNVSVVYHFTTKNDSPIIFSNENPVNNSIDVNISMVLWNITIDDPNGDLFNWTIECSGWNVTNDNYDSATGETNGSKEVHLGWQPGYPLGYSTVYTIWVNATDGVLWTRGWFRLTTIHFPYSILLSGEDPSNGSTIVYTFPGYLSLTHFNMSIDRNHSVGSDMNTTVWFNGTLLFTNTTWENGTITFDLFDYWSGVLIDGGSYNWMVNASENAVYGNGSYWFNFTVNVSGVVTGGPMLVMMPMDLSRFLFVGVLVGLISMLVLSRRRKKNVQQ